MERDYDELEKPSDDQNVIESKEKHLITKLLGAVWQTSYRLFQKFGNPKIYYGRSNTFADYYIQNFAQSWMEAHLFIISKKDKFVGRKAMYFSLRFIELFAYNKSTSPLLEPHMKKLLEEYLLPQLSINIKDAIEYDDNPQESIRKELCRDPQHSDNWPKIAAKGLLFALCSYKVDEKQEPVLLNDFLHLCIENLNNAKSDPSLDFRIKESTIYALNSITPIIGEYDHLWAGLEDMLTEHILYELMSENKYLRARALLYYHEITKEFDLDDQKTAYDYCDILYQNLNQEPQSLNVKVYTLWCIRRICSTEVGIKYFTDKVGFLLKICLDVMDEFFIEDLIDTLNEIVRVYYEEITPYSIAVWEKLADSYTNIMAELWEVDEELVDSKAVSTANGCVTAICRIIKSIGQQKQDNKKEVLQQIEEKVHSVLLNSLDNRFKDVHETILTCLAAILYHTDTVSAELWSIFPKLIEVLYNNIDKTWEYGCVSPGIMAIMNYMQKDQETFLNVKMESGMTPFDAIVNLTSKCIQDSHDCSDDLLHKTGAELIVSLLENLYGKIDGYIGHIIELLVGELQNTSETTSQLLLIQAISMWFTYNPALTFSIIEEKQWTQSIFEIWFDALPKARWDFEIKRMILGLTSIISCTDYQIPDIVCQGMPQIFIQLTSLIKKTLYLKSEKEKNEDTKTQELYEKSLNILDDWSDDEDDEDYTPEDDDSGDEAELYKSLTQEIDEVEKIKQTLNELDNGIFEAYFGSVSPSDKQELQQYF